MLRVTLPHRSTEYCLRQTSSRGRIPRVGEEMAHLGGDEGGVDD